MHIDRDTFLVTVYCIVDDRYRERMAPHQPGGPGRPPELADREVVTLVLLAQWHRARSERAFLAYVRHHWRGYFPHVLSRSAFNRRARRLVGVVAALGPTLGVRVLTALGEAPAYEVIDSIPVPVMRRCRGMRHRCFTDEVGIGIGGAVFGILASKSGY